MGEGRRRGNEKERKETFSPFPEIFRLPKRKKKGGWVKEKVLGERKKKKGNE